MTVVVASSVNPADHPAQHDFALIAGQPTPGVCKVTGGSRKHKWDVKAAKGSSGATTTSQGREPAKPQLKLTLWKDHLTGRNHIELYKRDLLPLLQKAEEGRTALDIYYPSLADNGISSVVVEEIGQLEPETDPDNGKYTVVVQLLEWSPPRPVTGGGTPKGSKQATKPYEPQGPDPIYPPEWQEAYEADIAKALAEEAAQDTIDMINAVEDVFG